ncbi:MAG: response regulator, partial [Candidatus Izimaplasma sp.]|nr:response regulator [Candidatus Izimaplasma bacterium]
MKMNILIVEDDPMVAHIHKHYLEELKNFDIIKVIDNGLDAFEFIKLNESKIDLVILDVHMPKLSGLEMLKLLREEGSTISVIPITAINDNKTISEFLNLGIVDYLVKPFTQERFNQAVLKCELKYKMFETHNELSQKQLDQMLNIATNSELPKGLQENTLSHIIQSLKAFKGDLVDVETISEATNLS